MVKISNSAYYPSGNIKIGEDEYTAAVTSAMLTPTTPTTALTDVGGNTVNVAGKTTWVCALSVTQDVVNETSLSRKLIEWAGTVKPLEYTPAEGGPGFTVDALIVAGAIGGAGGSVANASVTFPVNGQPVIA